MAVFLAAGEICNIVLEACFAQAGKNFASGGGDTTVVAQSGLEEVDGRVDGLFVLGQPRRQVLCNLRHGAVTQPGPSVLIRSG